jgi:hypothetical protein
MPYSEEGITLFGRDNSVIGDITLYVVNKLQLCMCKDNIKVGRITLYVEV